MNWNYSNIDKICEYGVLSTIDLKSFPAEKICGGIVMCKCTKSCNKTTYFCLKTKLNRKENVRNF